LIASQFAQQNEKFKSLKSKIEKLENQGQNLLDMMVESH